MLSQQIKDRIRKTGAVEFSDRFVAIGSNTSRFGNSLKAPLQYIHEQGLIPKRLLPKKDNMTWEEYHDKSDITGSMLALGQNFLRHFSINYEKVLETKYKTFNEMLGVAGYAWPQPVNGVYPKTDDAPNHAFMTIRPAYFVFDNYFDEGKQGDFIKQLSPDYDFYNYGYRIIISLTIHEQYNSILSKLAQILKDYLAIISRGIGRAFKN